MSGDGTPRETWLLVTGDFVRTGGMDRANYHLARCLADDSSRHVHLVAHRVDESLASSRANVHVHRVAKPLNSYLLGAPLLARRGMRVAHELRSRDPKTRNVVNGGNCPVPNAINWVHYVHAAFEPMLPPAMGTLRKVKADFAHASSLKHEQRAICDARVVIANSNRTKRDLIDRLGVKADQIHVVYYGADADEVRPAADRKPNARPKLAFIGALGDRRKGFDLLFDAWRSMPLDAELLVIGHGAELDAWRKRSTAEKLNIQFLGFRNDVPAILATCDGLVAPTRYEAFGLGVHEALCAGLPVIVSRDAGVAELVPDALRRLLIDPNQPAELIAALKSWRENLDHYRAIALAHSAQLRAHTWDDMARQIIDIADRQFGKAAVV